MPFLQTMPLLACLHCPGTGVLAWLCCRQGLMPLIYSQNLKIEFNNPCPSGSISCAIDPNYIFIKGGSPPPADLYCQKANTAVLPPFPSPHPRFTGLAGSAGLVPAHACNHTVSSQPCAILHVASFLGETFPYKPAQGSELLRLVMIVTMTCSCRLV
jgi:hypothetical protein